MRLFLRFTDLPELSQLSRVDRRRVMKMIPLGARIQLAVGPLVFGCLAGGLASVLAGADALSLSLAVVAGLVAAVMARSVMLALVRGGMVGHLHDAERSGRVTVCLRCGYDLQGMTGNMCPECGRRIKSSK